jgi:hypothetical protein
MKIRRLTQIKHVARDFSLAAELTQSEQLKVAHLRTTCNHDDKESPLLVVHKVPLLNTENTENYKAHGGSTSPPPSNFSLKSTPHTREGDNALQSFAEKRTFSTSPLTGEGRVGVSPFNLFVPALCLSASVVAIPRRIRCF